MREDRFMDRWVGHELGGLNQGIITRRRSLRDLLAEPQPRATTREGGDYYFDREVLEKFASVTDEGERRKLRLPITLIFHSEMENQCTLDDELAGEVLRRLEVFGKAYVFREGRMWLPYSLGLELTLRYPTAFQRLLLP